VVGGDVFPPIETFLPGIGDYVDERGRIDFARLAGPEATHMNQKSLLRSGQFRVVEGQHGR